MYFMLGQPTETEEDIEAIAVLSDKIAREYYKLPKDQRNGKVQIVSSTSFFVPKPFTPFQWVRMCTGEEFLEKQRFLSGKLKEQINRKSIQYNWHEAELTMLEGVFARGDRQLGAALLSAYQKGCMFDSWSEYFHYDRWLEAFEENGIDPMFYTVRERKKEELLPWDFIDAGVTKAFLWKEYERALAGQVTPNCKVQCSGCGAGVYQAEICVQKGRA